MNYRAIDFSNTESFIRGPARFSIKPWDDIIPETIRDVVDLGEEGQDIVAKVPSYDCIPPFADFFVSRMGWRLRQTPSKFVLQAQIAEWNPNDKLEAQEIAQKEAALVALQQFTSGDEAMIRGFVFRVLRNGWHRLGDPPKHEGQTFPVEFDVTGTPLRQLVTKRVNEFHGDKLPGAASPPMSTYYQDANPEPILVR